MALKPTFSLTIGTINSSSANPVAGPERFFIERDMDVPADGLSLHVMDRSGIKPGDQVSVSIGHDDQNETVFTGTVAAVRPAITGTEILAAGMMDALLNLRFSATFENQTAGNIVNQILNQAGVTPGTIDDGPMLPAYAIDGSRSAYSHIRSLADRLGYELYTDSNGQIMFRALGDAAGLDAGVAFPVSLPGGAAERYSFAQHLIAARSVEQRAPWATVEVGGESPMSGEGDTTVHWLTTDDSSYRGAAGTGDPTIVIIDHAARTKDLADRFAAGYLATWARTTQELTITILGRPQVDLGDDISAADLPDTSMNGSGYVRSIRHTFSPEKGFVTELRIALTRNR